MDMMIRFPNLGVELGYVGRSVRIFGFEITFGGMLLALGMLAGLAFIVLEAKRRNENQDAYVGMMITAVIFGLIGARLFYVGFSWDLYKDNILEIFNIRNGGMAFYGGLLGGMLGAVIYCGIRRLSFMKMADTACMGLVVAQIIGRWGDFFNRESFGEYTNSVLAMQLPLSSVRSSQVSAAMRENLVTVNGVSFVQVHPAFFYESAWCLVLFLLLLVWKRRKSFQGEIFLRYLTGYGLGRFLLEWIRTDKLVIPGTGISVSMVISVILFVLCGIMGMVRRTMAKKRAKVKKRRREEDYEAEEKAAREAEGHDSLEADDLLSETHTKENPEDPDAEAAKEAGQTDPVPSGSAEESGNEPEA